MLLNVLPVERSHSSLDIFQRPPLLNTLNTSFEEKIGPVYAPNGPTLEFEVVGDRKKFIDLQNIYLGVKCRILRLSGDKLEYDAGNAAAIDATVFVIINQHSFSLSAVLLRIASKFLLLLAIKLKKLSSKQNFHTTRKQKILA